MPASPTTHELGGALVLDDSGTVVGVDYVGQKCRDADGVDRGQVQREVPRRGLRLPHPPEGEPTLQWRPVRRGRPPPEGHPIDPLGLWQYTATLPWWQSSSLDYTAAGAP